MVRNQVKTILTLTISFSQTWSLHHQMPAELEHQGRQQTEHSQMGSKAAILEQKDKLLFRWINDHQIMLQIWIFLKNHQQAEVELELKLTLDQGQQTNYSKITVSKQFSLQTTLRINKQSTPSSKEKSSPRKFLITKAPTLQMLPSMEEQHQLVWQTRTSNCSWVQVLLVNEMVCKILQTITQPCLHQTFKNKESLKQWKKRSCSATRILISRNCRNPLLFIIRWRVILLNLMVSHSLEQGIRMPWCYQLRTRTWMITTTMMRYSRTNSSKRKLQMD